MDEHEHEDEGSDTDQDPVKDQIEEAIEVDRPVDLVPKTALDYHPLVTFPLDLLVDYECGVILGRSESFHRKYGLMGLGMIGAVSETSDDDITSLFRMPVNLDLMSPHVMLVAGKRGSGKSYTMGIIAEELALAMERMEIEVAAVLIDTVDVFRQTVDPNKDQEDLLKKWNLDSRGFPVAVYIPRRTYNGLPDEVKQKSRLYPLAISPRELTVSDWGYVLEKGGQLSTAMENLIGDVLDSVRKGYALESGERVPLKRDFSISEMIDCIENNVTINELYKASSRMAMIQRLRRADRLGVFHPGGTSAQDLAVPGQITIVDVAPLGSDAEAVLAILTNMLCRQVLTYRMAWTDEGTSAREELPPTWLIIDEAHTLVPRSGSTPAKDAIVGYAKLGRRFGCSLVLCTQQPSAVADEAISQADMIISHSLSHDTDIRALQQRAPAVLPEMFRDKVFISSLPRGVAIVFDQSTENKRGFIMQVRPRMSKHGGTDRLSGLFEAVRLLIPDDGDETSAETEEVVDEDILPEIEDEIEELEEEHEVEDLPEVPRPPVKLSEEDWKVLDDWMKDYVQMMFEEKMQEFSITDEPAPRETREAVEDAPVTPTVEEEELGKEPVLDASILSVREFGPLSHSLLAKAMTRKVLYSSVPHSFLFANETVKRETVLVQTTDTDREALIEKVAEALTDSGMQLNSIKHDGLFSFALFRKNGVRVAFSVGTSGEAVCIPVVFTGVSGREVITLADKVRTKLS